MTGKFGYGTVEAFASALLNRFRAAHQTSRYLINELAQRTATEAIDLVKALLEPLLDDVVVAGNWEPQLRSWS